MTDQDTDDEIRESIPCADEGMPLGYRLDLNGSNNWVVVWRGRIVAHDPEWGMLAAPAAARDPPVDREKAKRARDKAIVRTLEEVPARLEYVADMLEFGRTTPNNTSELLRQIAALIANTIRLTYESKEDDQ